MGWASWANLDKMNLGNNSLTGEGAFPFSDVGADGLATSLGSWLGLPWDVGCSHAPALAL